jgi:hypothetical protein
LEFDCFNSIVGSLIAAATIVEIDVPWGGALPATLGVMITGSVLLSTHDFVIAAVAALVAIAMAFLPTLDKHETQIRLLTYALDLGVVCAIAFLLRQSNVLANAHHKVSSASLVFVGITGLGLAVTDLALRFVPLPTTKYSLKHVAQMYAALVCEAAFVVLGWQMHNWLAFSTGLIMGAVTWYFCRNYRVASSTREQSVMAVGLLPEVAGFSSVGHAERCGVYADALAEKLGFGPVERDRIRTAARVMRVGYVQFPEAEAIADGMAVPTHDDLLSATDRVLSQASFLQEVEPLIKEALVYEDNDVSLAGAVLRIVASFDDFVIDDSQNASLAAMRLLEQFLSGPSRRAALSFAALIAERPELVDMAQLAAGPMFDAAAAARAEIVGD